MAVITPTITDVSPFGDKSAVLAVWTPVTEADSYAAITMAGYASKTIQAAGTFGSSSTALQGSLDGTNFAALPDLAGSSIALTSAGIKSSNTPAVQVKPVTTGGTSQSLTISVLFNQAPFRGN